MNNNLFDVTYIKFGRGKIIEGWKHDAFSSQELSYVSLSEAVILSSRGWIDGKLSGGIIDSEGNYLRTSGYVDGGGDLT